MQRVREPLNSRFLFPLTERRFTYAWYERFLDRLAGRDAVPMREFAQGRGDLALRHDVDVSLESALELARREHSCDLRATYFVLHTATYWPRPDLLERLRELQSLGHEVGFHNNYAFVGWDEPVPGFPELAVRRKLDPAALGLEYEAYHVPRDEYFSDSSFVNGRRCDPLDYGIVAGRRTIVLVHPCHWDRSAFAKVSRLAVKLARRR